MPFFPFAPLAERESLTSALINSSFRIECHPGMFFFLANVAKSLAVRSFRSLEFIETLSSCLLRDSVFITERGRGKVGLIVTSSVTQRGFF